MNSIICGDNAKVLAGFPDDYIDLTVTSPPYDNLRDYNGYSFDFEAVAKQLYRVTKPGGVVVWVVGDATINGSETGTSFRQALYFMECGFNLHDTMIYEKKCLSFPDANRYYSGFEYMFILSRGGTKTFNAIKDRKNKSHGDTVHGTDRNKDGTVREERSGAGNIIKKYGVRFNVWSYPTGGRNIDHPAPFPEALANDHILSWSNPGDLVLDPFGGSGTTGKKAKELGRDYIMIDSSFEYCQLMKKRLAATNPPLFT